MPTLTKLAADVFASVDGSSNPRDIVEAEAATWGTEIEAVLDDDVVHNTGAETIAGVKTFSDTPVLGAGTTINLDSATATLSSNAATLTKFADVITTESLTTVAGSSQDFTLTLTGVAATDLTFLTPCGGTNTRRAVSYEARCTSNTVTVTVFNNEPTNALNGTLKFNLWVLKA